MMLRFLAGSKDRPSRKPRHSASSNRMTTSATVYLRVDVVRVNLPGLGIVHIEGALVAFGIDQHPVRRQRRDRRPVGYGEFQVTFPDLLERLHRALERIEGFLPELAVLGVGSAG